jgi:hypothetical protein
MGSASQQYLVMPCMGQITEPYRTTPLKYKTQKYRNTEIDKKVRMYVSKPPS